MLIRRTSKQDLKYCMQFMKQLFPESFKRTMKTMLLPSQHILSNKERTYWAILDTRDKYCVKIAYHGKSNDCRTSAYLFVLTIIKYCQCNLHSNKIIATVRKRNNAGLRCLIRAQFIPIFECKIYNDPAIKFIKFINNENKIN